jgi:TfoX/Sxy family transcriptional regulator of competence genes
VRRRYVMPRQARFPEDLAQVQRVEVMPTKKIKQKTHSPEIDPSFQHVVDAFAAYRDVTGGKMMSSYGLKVNGKIFAMFGRRQFVTKLPKARVDALVSAGDGKRFDPGQGRLMKEWVVVRDGKADWVELAKEAYQFVNRGKS